MPRDTPAASTGDAGRDPRPSRGDSIGTSDTVPRAEQSRISLIPHGTVLDEVYRIQQLIGRGAMGAVYLAEHTTLGKEFAVKVIGLRSEEAPSAGAVHRLIREARAASAVEHDNIVNVTHLGRLPDGFPFVVMELLRGENLREHHVRVSGGEAEGAETVPLDDGFVRRVVSDVLRGLQAAHEAGVVHRDLKPDNIFLAEKRDRIVPKIVDFGMSKVIVESTDVRVTKTGQILGTPLYMAPEQGKSIDAVDERSDIYSMGVIAYEMLTGRVPFQAETIYECVFRHISEPPPPLSKLRPDAPEEVAACIHRALAKDPEERFQTAADFRAAWEAAWAGHVVDEAVPAATRASDSRDAPAPAEEARGGPSIDDAAAVAVEAPDELEPSKGSRGWYVATAIALLVAVAVAIVILESGPTEETAPVTSPPAPLTEPSAPPARDPVPATATPSEATPPGATEVAAEAPPTVSGPEILPEATGSEDEGESPSPSRTQTQRRRTPRGGSTSTPQAPQLAPY